MKVALVLTNDWELFGSGWGDFAELQQRPLTELMEVVQEFGAKMTLFPEMGQQIWGARRRMDSDDKSKCLALAWEESLRTAVKRGADVQCHLHPQWLDAEFENGRWRLAANYATGAVGHDRLLAALQRSKDYLENLLAPVDPGYRCLCYRAGGFFLEPSAVALGALRAAGFVADSSALLGLYEPPLADYRQLPAGFHPWRVGKTVLETSADPAAILELPVYARVAWDSALLRKVISPRLSYWFFHGVSPDPVDIQWQRRRNALLLRRYPLNERFQYQAVGRARRIASTLLNQSAIPLDYDQLPPCLFVEYMRGVLNSVKMTPGVKGAVPVVALGHTKGMPDTGNLRRILEAIKREFGADVGFSTVQQAVLAAAKT